MVSLLAVGVAMFAGWVLWQQLQPPARQPVQPSTGDMTESPPPTVMSPPSDHVAVQGGDTDTDTDDGALRRPSRIARPSPPSVPKPDPTADSSPDPSPPFNPDIDADLTAAYAAMIESNFASAEELLASAAEKSGKDRANTRVDSWNQLLLYAKGYADFEKEAVGSVASGQEYDTALGKIAIVEFTDETFIFRSQGQTIRRTPMTIPSLVIEAIVLDWLDERPANLLYIGAHHFTKQSPDVAAARTAWEQALASGSDAQQLLSLLEDPAAVR
jgi:hypothetical protein